MRENDDGELIKRWREVRRKWGPYWIPSMVVDKMVYDYIREAREDYPEWEKCVEDMDEKAIINYIRRLWRWILRWK